MAIKELLANLPEVKAPTEKRLGFNIKLKWTLIMLVAFFVLANISVFGLHSTTLEQFEYLAMILGAKFGSITTLGIGPIVMASIILQLLVGSKILNIDLTTTEGKKFFQGLQKILAIFFCIFEAIVYVLMGGIRAIPGMTGIVIFQIFLGGLLIIFMDEVVSKWGFGSGVSLFILAGVGWELFTRAFGFLGPHGQIMPVGKVFVFFSSLIEGYTAGMLMAAAAILATILIFLFVVYAQSIKVEVPLSFGRIRGYGMRWPLNFFYTSVIPVILAGALLANIQLFARLAESRLGHATFLGGFMQGTPISGMALWLYSPNLIENIIRGSFQKIMLVQGLFHLLFFVGFSTLFAVFWVKTSGMDAKSQAENILSSGLQIPGFRRDPRILEAILNRYIMPLTIMGGAAIGFLASATDLLGALVSGTGILLAVMIAYTLYQEIAQQHAYDMYPGLKKVMEKI